MDALSKTNGTPPPLPRRAPDVEVHAHESSIVFDPKTLRAEAWLARHLPDNRDVLGYYYTSLMRGSYFMLCMTQDGLEVR